MPGKGKEQGLGEGRKASPRCQISRLGTERGWKDSGQEELRQQRPSENIPAGQGRCAVSEPAP